MVNRWWWRRRFRLRNGWSKAFFRSPLADVSVTSPGKTGFYAGRVSAAVAASLGPEFRYPLAAQALQVLEGRGGQPKYRRRVRGYHVTSIGVTDDAPVFSVDFRLIVK